MIRDINTGTFYDIRIQNTATVLNTENLKLTTISNDTDGKPWKDWWEKKRDQNDQLLSAAEKGKLPIVVDLLNKKKHGDLIADINVKGLDGFTPLHQDRKSVV